MSMSVPAILKYLSNSNSYNIMGDSDSHGRAKKRRLDHLTWEEKIQRKKLKNRVAAQTSRDRKKAKMEQMESAIQDLFKRNEDLESECESLQQKNDKLTIENAELLRRLEWIYRVPLSAEGSGQTLSSVFGTSIGQGPLEDCAGLPSLPDLLDELNRDVDLNSLEEITQSLLQDIAADLEASAQKANSEESDAGAKGRSGNMVGSTPECLEPSGRKSVKDASDDLSSYLLLHHNYFAKRDPDRSSRKRSKPHANKSTKLNTKTKFVEILPKIKTEDVELPAEIIIDDCSSGGGESDLIYGTYDKNTNCIIIVSDDDMRLDEVVTEITTSDSSVGSDGALSVPSDFSRDSLSPAPSSGYESIGSPNYDEDFWDDCVSELFPSLI